MTIPFSTKIDGSEAFRKSQHFVVLGWNHELSFAVDKAPLAVRKGATAVFLEKVNLFETRGDNHLARLVNETPLSLPLYGRQALAENGGVLILGFHQKFSRPADKAPLAPLLHRRGLVAEKKGVLKAGFDDKLALAIDEAPLAILFDRSQKVGKGKRVFVLGFEDKLTRRVYIAPTSPPGLLRLQIHARIGLGENSERKN